MPVLYQKFLQKLIPHRKMKDLETSPEYARMISEAERSRSSCGSNDGSVSSTGSGQSKSLASPATPTSPAPGDGNDDFLNKVCKFEMISRVKSPTAKSPGVKSPTSKTPTNKLFTQDNKKSSPTSPFGVPSFVGEKVFTRDTATTRVSASLLQGLSTDRAQSTGSTISSNSLTSVSTLSWNSDASDTSAGSAKGHLSTGSAGKDIMTTSDPGLVYTSQNVDSGAHNTSGQATRETYSLSASGIASGGTKRGGIIDLSTASTHSISSTSPASSSTFLHQQQPTGITKKFITLSSTDKDYPPAPVVKPLQTTSAPGFPFITPNNAASPETRDNVSPSVVNGSSFSRDSGGSGKHRNTFEGMDFELTDLPSQQQTLALKHREVVAERKMEQEREKKDKQRLDEILKMCEEYQNEVIHDVSFSHSPQPPKQFGFTAAPHQQQQYHTQQHNTTFPQKVQPPGALELHLESPTSPNSEPSTCSLEGIYASKVEASSLAYSSNSEDETVGTSEDTGTIKKRPNTSDVSPTHKQENQVQGKQKLSNISTPKPITHLTISQNAITMTADIAHDNTVVTTTSNFSEHVTVSLPDQHEAEYMTSSKRL
ncbi:hypothetical protein Btru_021211 [Bulinus truncatus]|nr:hypothetical protein Btru_021211 [Bulinus truncatus]